MNLRITAVPSTLPGGGLLGDLLCGDHEPAEPDRACSATSSARSSTRSWRSCRPPRPRASSTTSRSHGPALACRAMHRDRFPGLADGWARLDGPAGTQMLDSAIEAMSDWMRSGDGANHGGAFQAAQRTDALLERTRTSVARLLGGAPGEVAFGPSMTAMTMRFSAAVGRTLAGRRRARLHPPGPRRERRPVADRRRARRRDGALRRPRPRDARAPGRDGRGPADASARAGSR